MNKQTDAALRDALKELKVLLAQRDCLLQAAKAALALITDDGTQGGKTWTVKKLRSAIKLAQSDYAAQKGQTLTPY